ncbi:hypothetical protein [Actinomadura hibisca]|nr:hypothetical protein [Actinomadura hibisca]
MRNPSTDAVALSAAYALAWTALAVAATAASRRLSRPRPSARP